MRASGFSLISIKRDVNMSEKKIMGLYTKTWVILVLISLFVFLSIFIIIPYLLATFIPIIDSDNDYSYLVDSIDGASLLVGIVGTIASAVSIIMTLLDRSRYNQEKTQTDNLFNSMNNLHKEIKTVNMYVKKTFEQNQRLAFELYENKTITVDSDAEIGVSINERLQQSRDWTDKEDSGEIIND